MEKEIGLRAATALLDTVEATFCDGLGCLSFAVDDRSEEARREDSSLEVIVAASGRYCIMRC